MAPQCSDADINAEISRRQALVDSQDMDLEKREELLRAMNDGGHPLNWMTTSVARASDFAKGPECDSACLEARRLADAKATWLKAKRQAEAAPGVAARAEETYLLLKGGEKAYMKVLEGRYSKHAKKWAKESLDRNKLAMTDLAFMIGDYETTYNLIPRLRELAVIREKEEAALNLAVKQRKGGAHAGDRRVVYEVRELDSLRTFRTVGVVLTYLVLLVWLLFGPFMKDEMYRMWFVWVCIIAYVAWPWVVPSLGRWLVWFSSWVAYQWRDRPYRNVALTI